MQHGSEVRGPRSGIESPRRLALSCIVACALAARAAAQIVPPPTPVKLTAAGASAGDSFGASVAYSHGRIAVGAPRADLAGSVDAGAVYAFTFDGSNWVQEPRLTTASVSAGAEFGRAIAMSEDTLVVGAWRDARPAGPASGSAWVFTRAGSSWGSPMRLPAGVRPGDEFGASVAVRGDWIAVGAPSLPDGQVTLYQRKSGAWQPVQVVRAFLPSTSSPQFGRSVAFTGVGQGDVLAVGAPGHASGSIPDTGAVYLFERSAERWRPRQFLPGFPHYAGGGVFGVKFGRAVSAARRSLFVASDREAIAFTPSPGGTWMWRNRLVSVADSSFLPRTDVAISNRAAVQGRRREINDRGVGQGFQRLLTGNISYLPLLLASDGASGDFFGHAVAIEGDSSVLGAPSDDHAGGVDAGSAYVYRSACPPDAWTMVDPGGGMAPSPRQYAEMVWMSGRRRILLFGGTSGEPANYHGDTWEWDGARWWQRTLQSPPAPRRAHAMVHETLTGRVILFGGLDGVQRFGDMWQWNGSNWTQISNSGAVPSAPAGHRAVYDSNRARIVMYRNPFQPGSSLDTFEWFRTGDATGQWVQFPTGAPGAGPGQRMFQAMAYDAVRRVTVLHGGQGSQILGDTWTWDGQSWRLVASGGAPSLRDHVMVQDGATGELVIVGGVSPSPAAYSHTTSLWDGLGWRTISAATTPANEGRSGAAGAWDGIRRRVTIFGGSWNGHPSGFFWYGDTRAWGGARE